VSKQMEAATASAVGGTSEGVAYRWTLRLYPEAGEAGGCLRVPVGRAPSRSPNLERSAQEAVRRASARIRRYCAANGLDRLGTLTYGGDGCHDRAAVRRDVGSFFKELRAQMNGEAFPYVWVPEWHPRGHGIHVHFALGLFVPHAVLRDAWGRGIVDIRRIRADCEPGELPARRLAARYLAKYVSKSHDQERPRGEHRYEVAQRFQPRSLRIVGRTQDEVIRRASEAMGAAPARVWRSSDQRGSLGPPTCWCAW
jgi:hypothetical protein